MSSANSLRPAWHRGNQSGKGFQPPPTVSERGRSQSLVESKTANLNAFAALDDDEEVAIAAAAAAVVAANAVQDGNTSKGGYINNSISSNYDINKPNSRSEALRAASRSMSTGAKAPSTPGRSLADLAARAPDSRNNGSRFVAMRSDNVNDNFKDDAKVIRFTREKLLSMRPAPPIDGRLPKNLEELEGTSLVSDVAQDPVCWDPNFDAEVIWGTVPRRVSAIKPVENTVSRPLSTRTREVGSSGRWQRGVALPPPDQAKKSGSTREKDAESPNELWDDPLASGAATDFSAFGSMPTDDAVDDADDDIVFNLEKMAEVTRKFEEDVQSSRSRASSVANSDDAEINIHSIKVDPKRPLATIGTTIRSGSGDGVNVFEDFDDPAVDTVVPLPSTDQETPTIKSADEDPSASSRLMNLIGVTKEDHATTASIVPEVQPKTLSPWGDTGLGSIVADQVIPRNPWSAPVSVLNNDGPAVGLDIQAHLREAAELEQKKREAENSRRRQEQEEAQRRLAQQAEDRARQLALQQQQAGVQSQVELVLMERISTILENSWGRADPLLILQTLHAEDARVIPLLSNVEALRALILRHPRRMTIRQDPAFGSEMATLVLTNAQWQQQHQQQEARVRAQQEESRRRELQQQRHQEDQKKAANAAAPPVLSNAPWYYSDPQRNIQGPFRANEMRQWLEAGYFKGDLPISQQPTGPFRTLSAIFPNLEVAFLSLKDFEASVRAKAEAEEKKHQAAEREKARLEAERARLEAERARHEAAERARKESEAKAERERLAREAAEAAEHDRLIRLAEEAEKVRRNKEQTENSNGGNESSTQLKMMLGLSGLGAAHGMNGIQQEPSRSKSSERNLSKMANESSFAATQHANKEAPPTEQVSSPGSTAPTSAWGGAAQAVTRKSISEIQNEEARAAAMLTIQREGSRLTNSGWANVAAVRSGNTVWSGATVRPSTSVAVPAPSSPTAIGTSKRLQSVTSVKPHSQAPQPRPKPTTITAESFGANMSPAVERWCKDQMEKLNGSDDLTLVSFCNTLNDPVEIRQYLTAYLGSTPQVNNFATEFINKKGLGTSKQEEWESTATSKKSRKKKIGGR